MLIGVGRVLSAEDTDLMGRGCCSSSNIFVAVRGAPSTEQGPPGLHQVKNKKQNKNFKKGNGNNHEEWGYCRREQVKEVVWGQGGKCQIGKK